MESWICSDLGVALLGTSYPGFLILEEAVLGSWTWLPLIPWGLGAGWCLGWGVAIRELVSKQPGPGGNRDTAVASGQVGEHLVNPGRALRGHFPLLVLTPPEAREQGCSRDPIPKPAG